MNNSAIILHNLSIVTHRGIQCISTFPKELVWGPLKTVLECANCIEYASYNNILIGLCKNCASFTYKGKYGCGYEDILKEEEEYEQDKIPVAFGNLKTNDVINKLNLMKNANGEYILPPSSIQIYNNVNNSYHIFSVYDMVIKLSKNDIKLLTKKNNYSWIELYKYYFNDLHFIFNNDDDEFEIDLLCVLDATKKIQNKYKLINQSGEIINENVDKILFNAEFYKECSDYELMFRKTELEKIKEKNLLDIYFNFNKKKCGYCNIYKPKEYLKKCEGCEFCYYCSVACQTRDWQNNHKKYCKILKKKMEYEKNYYNYDSNDDSNNDLHDDSHDDYHHSHHLQHLRNNYEFNEYYGSIEDVD